jgi:hypothetical protein
MPPQVASKFGLQTSRNGKVFRTLRAVRVAIYFLVWFYSGKPDIRVVPARIDGCKWMVVNWDGSHMN